MKTSNTHLSGSKVERNFFKERILNYYPDLSEDAYNLIMELELQSRQELQGIARALGFTFYSCPLLIVKEYYLEKYPNDIILAKYWTARTARVQQNSPEKRRGFQKTAGFATLYGGSTKVTRLPNNP